MRTLFILCTAVTVLQVYDGSITGTSAAVTGPNGVADPNNNTATGTPTKTATRALKKTATTKPKPVDPQPGSASNDPGSKPDDDSGETDPPPKTVKESGKRVVQTIKRVASKKTMGLLNGVNGILKSAGNFGFFGNLIRNQSNNVKAVAKDSLQLISDFGDSSSKGARNVLNSSRVIGRQGGRVLFSALQNATNLGKNLTKLGGTVINTPISIGGDIVGTASRLAKAPINISKLVTNKAINPALNILGKESEEEEEEGEGEGEGEEEEEKEEKKEEPAKPEPAKPSAPIQTPKKPMNKKPTK